MSFLLHPQLQADTDIIGEFPLCLALLHKEDIGPWVILVPKKPNLQELHHLPMAEQQQFLVESQTVFESLETLYKPKKLNLGALGNMVPQLHIHHIARFDIDIAWPKPVWGNTEGKTRNQESTQLVLAQLRHAFMEKYAGFSAV
ncbi:MULTISPECIES: HIT family protein [Vibrio]|uniref:HIT domain-containing protein n=1 Tax=Vibrio casei TaxID=673372 RepID=A0A368LLU1_9VIBR|nr:MULTISPECIES: HIT domain-containing protein [Vibrio]RCS72880.1 HIT domain-containing protein [Vibrio casei]SJN38661.1 Diadenosine tetraphosphate (Ap4A) hydrolase and other HIT family hydrolases [Vibrio casei]HBV75265.1 HIT domain-containing protein [Vibrio sp.]